MIFLFTPQGISASIALYKMIIDNDDTDTECNWTNKDYIENGWKNYYRQKTNSNKKFAKVSLWQTIIWFIIILVFGWKGQIAFRIYFGIFVKLHTSNFRKFFSIFSLISLLLFFNYPGNIFPPIILCFGTFWGYPLYHSLISAANETGIEWLETAINFIFDIFGFLNINDQYKRDIGGFMTSLVDPKLNDPYKDSILMQLKYLSKKSGGEYNIKDMCKYENIESDASTESLSAYYNDSDEIDSECNIELSFNDFNWLDLTNSNDYFWYNDYYEDDDTVSSGVEFEDIDAKCCKPGNFCWASSKPKCDE